MGDRQNDHYLEHVLHVVRSNERVVDGNDLERWVRAHGTAGKTADAAEAVDAHLDGASSGAATGFRNLGNQAVEDHINGACPT